MQLMAISAHAGMAGLCQAYHAKSETFTAQLIYAIKVSLFHHDTDERYLIEIDDAANTCNGASYSLSLKMMIND